MIPPMDATPNTPQAPHGLAATLGRGMVITLIVASVATVISFVLHITHASPTLTFCASAIALGSLAVVVGHATDQLGNHMSPGATGVIQSALGNLPEFFICIFALQQGLVTMVQNALLGAILANSLLLLGLALFLGGRRHGVLSFGTSQTRLQATLLLLSVAALCFPALATAPGAPDEGHAVGFSVVVSVVLLIIFAASIPFSMAGGPGASAKEAAPVEHIWPLKTTWILLAGAAVGAAFASEWFVHALQPAMAKIGISEGFVGLVIVAIAGNAVEHVAGVQAAMKNKPDLAMSLILNSSLQISLFLTPALVIISLFIGPQPMTLVVPALLIAAVAFTALLSELIIFDGEGTWLEGLALIGLYVIIAASFWWGAPMKTADHAAAAPPPRVAASAH